MSTFVVSALYQFVTLDDFEALRAPLLATMKKNHVYGTLLLAQEGINGTIAGTREGIDATLSWLRSDPRLANLNHKESFHEKLPFKRCKVKLKKEIVTMGVEGIDPKAVVGTYVSPSDWNALISDPEVLLVDTRNAYEVQIGTFTHAINPNTGSFREFPQFVADNLDKNKHKKVAMFCTGGIRCEKSTAYLKEQGFENVYHLQGGILKYLEEVPEETSLWQGECFVFDDRVAVNHQLEKGHYDQCHACRRPITDAEKTHEHYVEGISCHQCYDQLTATQKARFSQRQLQMTLAEKRGEAHIGSAAQNALIKNRTKKKLAVAAQKNAPVNSPGAQ